MRTASNNVNHLYSTVADRLEHDIVSGCFPEEKLPSEQALSEMYSVSRTVIREALKILSERSLVNTVVGSGNYITKPEVEDLITVIDRISSTHDFSANDVIEMRIILESNAAALAALNATEEEFDAMDAVREKLKDSSLTEEERVQYDFEFHMMICEAAHNRMLSTITRAICSIVKDLIAINIGTTDYDIQSRNEAKLISHAKILRTLRERNPIAAQSVMFSHLYASKVFYAKHLDAEAEAEKKRTEKN